MKITKFIFAAVVFSASAALAQVGVVNYTKLETDSVVAKATYAEMVASQKEFNDNLESKKKDYELIASGVKTALEAKEKPSALEQFELDSKLKKAQITYNRHVEDANRQFEEIKAKKLANVKKVIIEAVGKVAKEKKLNVVLASEGVLYSGETVDVTEDVLAALAK